MTKINKRYELEIEKPESICESWLAKDLVSGSGVLVKLIRSTRQELVDYFFENRCRTLVSFSHPFYMSLLDYGYDEANRWYYFVYPNLGIRLDRHLARAKSPRQVVAYLQQCAELMSKLHSQSITHGSLGAHSIFYDQESDQIKVYDTSLAELVALIKGEPNTESTRQQRDIDAFKNFMRDVWVSSDLSIPVPIEGLLNGDDFNTFQAINKQLELGLWEIEGENNHYLVMTSNCSKKLALEGFINGAVNWQASNFLQEELKRPVYALAEEDRKKQGMTYFLITSQMQLLCKRESDYFVIIDIWLDPPARLAQRQERALPIGASFSVVTDKRHISSGRRADIDSFAMEIEGHAKKFSQGRQKEYQDKDRFAMWEEYLEAHQKLLRQFKVRYSSWRQVENEPAIEVELDKELEETFSSEDLFRMNVGKGRMKVIGYYESLTDNVLKIALAAKVNLEDFEQDGQLELDNWQTELLLKRQKRALKRLKYQESVNPNLRSLLTQPETIEIDPAPAIKAWLQPYLDQSQQKAVRRALATRDLFLIQGPPGTGKTSTISELALQILAHDQQARILITSQSNVAVNHALLQILKLKPELAKRTIRVGRDEKTGQTKAYQIDRQLRAWGERVAEKSRDYVEELKANYSSLEMLRELLALLAECEEKSELQQRRRRELASQQEKLARLERDYSNLADALDKTRALRQQAEKLLADAAPQDTQLRQMLRSFKVDYLQWATDFLKRAEQVAEISLEKLETQAKVTKLEKQIRALDGEIQSGISLLNEFLRAECAVSFKTLNEQAQFIKQYYKEQNEEIGRLARIERVAKEWQSQVSKNTSSLSSSYISHCNLIGATCMGVAAHAISDMVFDWVIADEAGRATHPELLVPLVRGRKLLLVGDHRQLPPTISREQEEVMIESGRTRHDFDTSLFEELMEGINNAVQVQLNQQYRMHPAIGQLISDCFYDGNLTHGMKESERQHGLPWKAVCWFSTKRLPRHDESKAAKSTSPSNQAEVELIIKLLDEMNSTYDKKGISRKTVGVITGYMGQKRLLRKKIAAEKSQWLHLDIEINTVDAYQGRERDVIIYSVVRSNRRRTLGFLRDERRLNVALSRARELLLIVGNHDVASYRSQTENPFKRVLQHIQSNKNDCFLSEVRSL